MKQEYFEPKMTLPNERNSIGNSVNEECLSIGSKSKMKSIDDYDMDEIDLDNRLKRIFQVILRILPKNIRSQIESFPTMQNTTNPKILQTK